MITILRGRFSQRSEIDVPLGRIDLRPPKIIVGVSLTLLGEGKSLPQDVITLPAILDTGFNRTLEIDEWHLVRWAGLRKEHLASTPPKDMSQEGRKYNLCQGRIWLHERLTRDRGRREPDHLCSSKKADRCGSWRRSVSRTRGSLSSA